MFSCEFGEIFQNTFFIEHLWTTTSVVTQNYQQRFILQGFLLAAKYLKKIFTFPEQFAILEKHFVWSFLRGTGYLFYFFIFFTDSHNSQHSSIRQGIINAPLYLFHLPMIIRDVHLVLFCRTACSSQMLIDDIYLSPRIRIWISVHSILLSLDFMLAFTNFLPGSGKFEFLSTMFLVLQRQRLIK